MALTLNRKPAPGASTPVVLRPEAQGQWALAWRKFRRNTVAVLSLALIAVYLVAAALAATLAPHNPVQDRSGRDFLPPFWQMQSPAGQAYDAAHPLGTDQQGRDVLSRLLYGGRSSMVTGVLPVAVILLVGATLGFAAGFLGGLADDVIMRLTDVFFALPIELFLILVMVTLGDSWIGRLANGLPLFLIALALMSWSGLARLLRGQALQLRETGFVDAARSLGASDAHIIRKHIMPNSMGVIIVWVAFAVPRFIIAEAILGFIGLGLRPSLDANDFFLTSWGRLFLDGYAIVGSQPGLLLATAGVVSALVIAFTFLGDGLRDALDPRTR